MRSLDLIDQEMEEYIPDVLQDLWSLGSMPEYIIQLIQKNLIPFTARNIVDFGCGKGAVLINLAKHFDFEGLGIDIIPEFIESANQHAKKHHLSDKIRFEVADLNKSITEIRHQDIVIYGYDSECLGDTFESLKKLRKCIHEDGWIILEMAYTENSAPRIDDLPNQKELYQQIHANDLSIIDQIVWNIDELKKINHSNNQMIQRRINELIKIHPDKASIFNRYMENQLEECIQIENDMTCSTFLLR